TEYGDHPVVGVSGKDAVAYARWAGKRLPSAEEWEAAIAGANRSLFAWGDEWPGPLRLRRRERVFWELPGTRPIGTGACGRSSAGVEDFAGQALEWVSDVRPHHGVQFQLMKGASWFHEDPVNFRTASGWYAYEGWRSAFTGFRCALNGDKTPPQVAEAGPKKSISALAALEQLQAAGPAGPPELAASGGTSRHVSIRVPHFGTERIGLTAPETILWNGVGVMTWRKTPDMTWTERTARRAAYEMRFDPLRVHAEFLTHDDSVEQRFTATNLTDKPGTFRTSSCFNLQGHPMFYDCEQLRTHAMTASGRFVPVRRLARGGDCVRWITGLAGNDLGQDRRWALLAVVSRDGRRVIATGRAGEGAGFSVATNTLFTCLHTDSTIEVPPAGQATTRQLFWLVDGTLDDLPDRLRRDFDRGPNAKQER
ncbi:MAG: formylglycine-generating enzyme family protein, partial [Planctomycetota bacterium]